MSVRYFCDQCNVELVDGEHKRLKVKRGNLSLEIIHFWKGCSNAGNICHGCIRDAILRPEPDNKRLTEKKL